MMFLVLGLFSFIPINCLFLDPIANAISDFDVYDIVYSKLREAPRVDTNVVLVNIGNLSRSEIAEQIRIINQYNPKVVAIDAIFQMKKDHHSDSLLADAMSQCSNLVLVSKLENFNNTTNNYDTSLKSIDIFNTNAASGYANFPSDQMSFRTVREFKPVSKVNGKVIPAFVVKTVELYDQSAYKFLLDRKHEIEKINYSGNYNRYFYLDANQVLSKEIDLNFIKDKIVLIGFMGASLTEKTFEDIYFTPLNERYAGKTFPDMYGVVIHANIISMILNKNYVEIMPKWLSIILALLLSYLSAYIIFQFKIKYKDWFSALSKLYILFMSLFNLFIGVMVLHFFNFRMDLTLALAVIVLTNTIVEIYQSYIGKIFPIFER